MQTVTIPQALEIAIQHHRAGRLSDAEGIYRQILAQEPNHADALHFLGIIAQQVGRNDIAADFFRRAIAANPAVAAYHGSLGIALTGLGQLDEAIAAYRSAMHLTPNFVEAHNNLGNVLRDKGRIAEAIAAYRRALELKPDCAEIHYNLGNALKDHDALDEAILAYRRAIEIKPDYAEAHCNLGNALAEHRHFDDAILAYRRAIEFNPIYAQAHNNLGNALTEQGQSDEAILACRTALQLQPDFAQAHNNLGNALKDQRRFDEAISAYRHALELRPDYAKAQHNLASVLAELGRVDEAIALWRAALRISPDCPIFHSNILLFSHGSPGVDARALFQEHRDWNARHAQPLAKFIEAHAHNRDPVRRLRIGYVSPDFRNHPVLFFIEGILAGHDRNQVEDFCYADVPRPDPATTRLRRYAQHWRDITRMSDPQVADLVREDRIDILVDLTGHTARNRLLVFARKPAPVQVTWLGYMDTTGLSAVDYRLTDAHADPPGATEHLYSERLVRLPDIFACFSPGDESRPVAPLPALSRGHVTFASFHTLTKLNDSLLDWWATILLQVPNSRLMMVAAGLHEASSQNRLSGFFVSKGVEVERLEFKGRQSLPDYLALYHEVDLLLDTHPWSGHTIACHALWMGVPVVTLAGDRYYSRMVASVLANLGLPELIAQTPGSYVKIACELAADPTRLARMRSTLRERMQGSPVMDAARFTRALEHAYREMWRTWCARQPPSRS